MLWKVCPLALLLGPPRRLVTRASARAWGFPSSEKSSGHCEGAFPRLDHPASGDTEWTHHSWPGDTPVVPLPHRCTVVNRRARRAPPVSAPRHLLRLDELGAGEADGRAWAEPTRLRLPRTSLRPVRDTRGGSCVGGFISKGVCQFPS